MEHIPLDPVPSDRVLLDRRNVPVALTGGAALLLFAASRNTNMLAAPSFHVPEVSVAETKKLLDPGTAIAIDVRHAEDYPLSSSRRRSALSAIFGSWT